MLKYVLTILCLLTGLTATSLVASYEGIVTEVTPDTITVQQGGITTETFVISNELLTNTVSGMGRGLCFPAKLKDVKKGCKVEIDNYGVNEKCESVCIAIRREDPYDTGVITEVGKDTITILGDKGGTTTYKVEADLVDNSRDPSRYPANWPSRFGDAKPGRRIEVICYKKDGETIIITMDVKAEKEHEK